MYSSLYAAFSYYASDAKIEGVSVQQGGPLCVENGSFFRMCRQIPNVVEPEGPFSRKDIDLIFSKVKPLGERRLFFEHFLDALLELSVRLYGNEPPTNALTKFLVENFYGVFDQNPVPATSEIFESVYNELSNVI